MILTALPNLANNYETIFRISYIRILYVFFHEIIYTANVKY